MKRKHMPARYETTRQGVKLGGRTLYVDVGRDSDGVVRSIFLDTYKTGTEQRALVEVIARLMSIALQYDVPLAKLTKLIRGTKFNPHGIVTVNGKVCEKVRFASSPLDYVAKHVEEAS